jgi:uncharacterized protein YbcV (DUF1398 family)
MNFTIDQIKQAHSNVKSGADFPIYIQNLIKLGVKKYITHVRDGHTEYYGITNLKIQTPGSHEILKINEITDSVHFKNQLKKHQQGHTDYLTFCRDCAESGVDNWIVDMQLMTCTYFDKRGTEIVTESIPVHE